MGGVRTVEVRGTRIPQYSLGVGGLGAPPLLKLPAGGRATRETVVRGVRVVNSEDEGLGG